MSGEQIDGHVADALVRQATEAAQLAYAPYSRFHVGAALLTADGQVHTGANVENRSYSMSICAERTAVVKAVTASATPLEIVAVAVVESGGGPCAPCGGCRQIIAEFAGPDTLLIYRDARGTFKRATITEALPDARAFLTGPPA